MAPQKQFDVAIVGGGIAGLTLAIALHARNIPVKLYEQAHAFGEIGAGVSFHPSAVQAMAACHDGVVEAFNKVVTTNQWPSKQKVWFDYFNGFDSDQAEIKEMKPLFTIYNQAGQNAVHRARFLDEMIHLIPEGMAQFQKHLNEVKEREDGKLELHFADGSKAEADVVIGCDGIKSQVRQSILGSDSPAALPSYTHKYAYRGLIPMEKAVEAIGAEKAQNSCMFMGQGGHVLTFPVDHGKTMNVVAFITDPGEWKDYPRLTRMSTREAALKDFANYSDDVKKILNLCEEELSVWAIFDLGSNPCPTYTKGRVVIIGDAAHATSPHHGSGAGFCIEDSAVLAALLADERVNSHESLNAALQAYEKCRIERTHWLVQSSRLMGDAYEWQAPSLGRDFKKIEEELNKRSHIIDDADVYQMCDEAKEVMGKLLAGKA